MKHPLKLISIMGPIQYDQNGNFTEFGFCRYDPDQATTLAYIQNTGQLPIPYKAGSIAAQQYEYNPRKRKQLSIEELVEWQG